MMDPGSNWELDAGRHGLGRWDLLVEDGRLGLASKLAVAAVEKRAKEGVKEEPGGLPKGKNAASSSHGLACRAQSRQTCRQNTGRQCSPLYLNLVVARATAVKV